MGEPIPIPESMLGKPAPVRKPGDFRRKGQDGPPYVSSPTETRKPKGNKPELIAKCEARGLATDGTVADLIERLGAEPRDELYGRPSGFGDPLENSYALRKFIERGILRGALMLINERRLDPMSVGLDDDGVLDRLVLDAQDAADAMIWADRGTHVHMLIERHESARGWKELIPDGEALGLSEVLQRAIMVAWEEFRQALGARSLGTELAVVNDDMRIAGTLDLLDTFDHAIDTEFGTIFWGEAAIADVKTGALRDKYAVQVAGYQGATPYDVNTETRGAWDRQPVAHVGLIYHMPMKEVLDGAPIVWQAIPVDLAAGREGARICCEARDWPTSSVYGAPITTVTTTIAVEGAESLVSSAPSAATNQEEPCPDTTSTTTNAHASEESTSTTTTLSHAPTTDAPANTSTSLLTTNSAPETSDSSTPLAGSSTNTCTTATSPTQPSTTTPSSPASDRTKLRYRISDLIGQGHETEVRRHWPQGVPPLSQDGHTDEQLAQILDAVQRAEAEVGAQFHPDDSPPAEPRNRDLAVPATLVDPPDEGGEVDEASREALERAFAALPTDAVAAIVAIVGEAKDAGRHISVAAAPTVRRWSIARALVRWARDDPGADLFMIATDIATVEQTADPDQTLGALLGTFTIAQANALADVFSDDTTEAAA